MRHPECSSPALYDYPINAVPRSVAQADLVLADSPTRGAMSSSCWACRQRTRVVYAGLEPISPGARRPARRAPWRAYGIEPPYVLGVGTLQPRKNFGRLIAAFCLARERHRLPHRLVIAGGRGWLYDDILVAAREAGDAVLLAGYVDDSDLPALYSAADLFAFPSLYEGFGIPLLEAMGCGTPVLTAQASSLPEVAGDAALLVEPTDIEAIAAGL